MTAGELRLRAEAKTLVMGVLNATPDSFFAASRIEDPTAAVEFGSQILCDGADIIDVGGESSRPKSQPVGHEMELRRVEPILQALAPLSAAISIDTYRAATARRALECGAVMVNDITALRGDPAMAEVVAESGCSCILMHMLGAPATMQDAPVYTNVVDDICGFFEERITYATAQGIAENALWLDPGFGFGKTAEHNLEILRRLDEFSRFGLPVVIGVSNKSTIGTVLDLPPEERVEGTSAAVAVAIWKGVSCVRVHDVKAMARVAKMTDAIKGRNYHG